MIAAVSGRMFVSFFGVSVAISAMDIRSLTTRSIRLRSDAELILDQFADRTDTTIAQHIDIICLTDAFHDVQVVRIERIHIGNSNGVFICKRVITDDLDHIVRQRRVP